MTHRRTALTRGIAAAVGTALVASLTACGAGGSARTENGVTELRYQGWTNQVTPAELAQDLGFFDGKVKLDWVGNTISGPQDIQSAATGQTDFGGAFAGAVAKLASAGAPITAVINYYGADDKTFTGYYVKDDSPIRSVKDLIGKKIGVNTLGGQNEADIHDVLKKAGATADQIKSVQLVALPPPNTEDALRKGQIEVAALGDQFRQRAVAAGGIRPVFTEPEAFGNFNGGEYVLRKDFIKKNPDAVRAFTTGVARAIEWLRTTPRDQVIERATKIIQARHRPNETTSTLKYWQSVGIPSKYGKISDEDFTRWQSWLQDTGAISGPLNPSSLYTNEYNSLATGKQGS
ncbi:ABC transporter substrate-binding protein [Tsukamurella sp. 8F]|uniref:ABC transporter substrate-binding protein n=1 Tax=unclassified Tsukamurella TaxID=2633480 RepID=UPI0023B9C9AE|nr:MULTISPECIES: ABC transporter substrate-binding protein [unclassified Tsukamurella]MDF0530983.1 ABC transporter substrate-binding protein [Tsukamurella sp. 8J]MDF0588684.1 ABC transporter substrate-binding protein [Tsukamurella sp. 8F]